MSDVLDGISKDDSPEGVSMKKKVQESTFMALIGVASIIALHYWPVSSVYVGMIPGFAIGVASTNIGAAYKIYKKSKKVGRNEVI